MNWMLCIGIAIAWTIGSALLVYAMCMNCKRIREIEEQNRDFREMEY